MMVAPAKTATPFSCSSQRLHDDFFGVVDRIDHQPELTLVGLQHDDVDGRGLRADVFRVRRDRVRSTQIHERQQAAAQAVERGGAVDALDAGGDLFAFEANQFEQADLRNREAFAARWRRSARG